MGRKCTITLALFNKRGKVMAKGQINTIGLVGCGSWGKNILRDLLSLNCRVHVAVPSDSSQKKALELGAEKVFASAEALPECDGYIVAVPIPDLAPVTMGLLKRKKPIFAEKTLCLSIKAADDLEGRRRQECFCYA
jgi:predicted dehydrogenase